MGRSWDSVFQSVRRVSWYFWSMNYVLRMRYSLFSSKSRHVLLPSTFVHITAWGPLVMVLNGVGRYQAQLALCLSVCLSVEVCTGLSGFPARKLSVGCRSGRARCAGKHGAVRMAKNCPIFYIASFYTSSAANKKLVSSS